jgi:hypothetical protein
MPFAYLLRLLFPATLLLGGCSDKRPVDDGIALGQTMPEPVAQRDAQGPAYDPIGIPDFAERLLSVHNRERELVEARPLAWSDRLAGEAAVHARNLALLGRLEHSSKSERGDTGENLWMGTAASYRIERMVEGWAREKSMFRAGSFPYISTTGSWQDVGHYTQIIWPSTRAVGCAIARHRKWDYLVCRYSPAGNVRGGRVP